MHYEDIYWFNGGLFEKIEILPLHTVEIKILHEAAKLDWSDIEPSIFGTLFERGLDPSKRSQLGAHYTDAQSILRIIKPVIVEPLAKDWEIARTGIAEKITKRKKSGDKAERDAQAVFLTFLEKLKAFKVLDSACGSGNFLYLALRALKDLEHRANLDAEALGLHRQISIECSPANVLGIELNPYAAELARVTVWIGEIQWMLKNGCPIRKNPILQPLDHIENRDAILNADGSEAQWPVVDAIIGNPPFLGDKKMRTELGDEYTEALRKCYADRVPGGADLVTYWFEKSRAQIKAGNCQCAGLVATNSIRGGANQKVLSRICDTTKIFNAWSDEEWINEGAAVRVSLVCFGSLSHLERARGAVLDGKTVEAIHADLTSGEGLNFTQAKPLKENAGAGFIGTQKSGDFDIAGELARKWLKQPNPNGKQSSDVVRPWVNGMDITRRPSDTWIVDFGVDMSEQGAALYEIPFAHATSFVRFPLIEKRVKWNALGKDTKHIDKQIQTWHLLWCARAEMREALKGEHRYIGTPRVAKYRLFTWLNSSVLPDCQVVVIARSDDTTFGILHSRFHELWALRLGTSLEDRPRYTPSTTFETFPFPNGLTLNLVPANYANPAAAEIATTAQALNQLRENWLNPPEWVNWVRTSEEESAGYPLRPVAQSGHEADLKKRTLTNLYNARPAWLGNAHRTLDIAVAKAYGWNDYTPEMPDEEILRRLLTLNLTRTA